MKVEKCDVITCCDALGCVELAEIAIKADGGGDYFLCAKCAEKVKKAINKFYSEKGDKNGKSKR